MEKTGRNDPCTCGSGKKFKQCCLLKKGGSGVKRKITATWINSKSQTSAEASVQAAAGELNLMERAYGQTAQNEQKTFQPITSKVTPGAVSPKKEIKNEGAE